MVAGGSVVDWGDSEAPSHAPGPNSANYEAFRELCGAHLVYNAFWNVKHFCVHQMLMRDPMHQVDLDAIVHLIKAIEKIPGMRGDSPQHRRTRCVQVERTI